MNDTLELTPGKLQFIEEMGLYFEHYGIPRIGGRVLGLLMLTDRPLTLDAMAAALAVARSSISTNVRIGVNGGMVERVSFPGDRRDYYRLAVDTWDSATRAGIESLIQMRRVAERGLGAMESDDEVARARLTDVIDYCAFMTAEQEMSLARWRQQRAVHGVPATAPYAAIPPQ